MGSFTAFARRLLVWTWWNCNWLIGSKSMPFAHIFLACLIYGYISLLGFSFTFEGSQGRLAMFWTEESAELRERERGNHSDFISHKREEKENHKMSQFAFSTRNRPALLERLLSLEWKPSMLWCQHPDWTTRSGWIAFRWIVRLWLWRVRGHWVVCVPITTSFSSGKQQFVRLWCPIWCLLWGSHNLPGPCSLFTSRQIKHLFLIDNFFLPLTRLWIGALYQPVNPINQARV